MTRDLLIIAVIATLIGCTIVVHGKLEMIRMAIDYKECECSKYNFFDQLDIHNPDNVVLYEKPKLPPKKE